LLARRGARRRAVALGQCWGEHSSCQHWNVPRVPELIGSSTPSFCFCSRMELQNKIQCGLKKEKKKKKNQHFYVLKKESPYNATSRALLNKKISNGRGALWPKALLETQKMWVANYFKYPQQVKLDVEKYVLNIYFCLR